MSRKLEEFRPIGEKVLFYTCGPTVYNFAHIGNFRAYVCQDVLKRYLLYKGFSVRHVMNLTDVDDKTIRDSAKEGVTLSEFTERYASAFFEDCSSLGLLDADSYPKATKYVEEMIDLITALVEKGLAYRGEDGSIYYSVSKFPGYGKLSKIPVGSLQKGARVKQDEYSKEEANDFALWKAWSEEDGPVFWESPFGRGRPGWHIECSAMAIAELGETIDIHAGGIDLVFPHHEDEIAQSEGVTGKPFANYWIHNEYLLVDGKKMSKSFGNFYTLRQVLSKGYSGRDVRYILLATHYRQPLNFTFQALDGARGAIGKLSELALNLREIAKGEKSGGSDVCETISKMMLERFESAMDADLNTSEALAAVFEYARSLNKILPSIGSADAKASLEALQRVDSVLGILSRELSGEVESEGLPAKVSELAEKRSLARLEKRWNDSDALRTEIESLGYSVQDGRDGIQKIRKKLV